MNKTFYEVGKSYELDSKPKIAKKGFHCCSNFLHCFEHCGNVEDHKYFRVQLGTSVKNEGGVLFCGNEMHVIEEWDHKKVVESITEKICFEAISNDGDVLEFIPKNMKTPLMCFGAVSDSPCALEFVPKNMKTPQMCLAAVARIGWVLKYVPEKMKTSEMCLAAVLEDGEALEHVSENMKTLQICRAAFSENSQALQFVPKIFKELCKNKEK
jgi:hypothetical protein